MHITNITTEKLLDRAGHKCQNNGTKLTAKRKLVLQQLLESKQLLSAYDIVDRIKKQDGSNMPAMSVYRILDFLQSANLAHKLESQNKYIACRHIACDHAHESAQFLICQKCFKVKEIDMSQSTKEEIIHAAQVADFQLDNLTLEIKGYCQTCQSSQNKAN